MNEYLSHCTTASPDASPNYVSWNNKKPLQEIVENTQTNIKHNVNERTIKRRQDE